MLNKLETTLKKRGFELGCIDLNYKGLTPRQVSRLNNTLDTDYPSTTDLSFKDFVIEIVYNDNLQVDMYQLSKKEYKSRYSL